jgi:hypothetical protein
LGFNPLRLLGLTLLSAHDACALTSAFRAPSDHSRSKHHFTAGVDLLAAPWSARSTDRGIFSTPEHGTFYVNTHTNYASLRSQLYRRGINSSSDFSFWGSGEAVPFEAIFEGDLATENCGYAIRVLPVERLPDDTKRKPPAPKPTNSDVRVFSPEECAAWARDNTPTTCRPQDRKTWIPRSETPSN